jgi:hypothetical protein
LLREVGSRVTSEGPTNQWKKGTVNAALNSSAHFVGGNNFLNCSNINSVRLYLEPILRRLSIVFYALI